MRTRILSILPLLIALTLLVLSCQPQRDLVEDRVNYSLKSEGDILIGVSWPFSEMDDHFKEGLILARDQINDSGGLLGRRIALDFQDNHGDLKSARKIAHDFARNKRMTAVIGHAYSSIAMETSLIYENAGLLLLTPRAQLSSLSEHGLQLFFRTTPSNLFLGRKAAYFTSMLNFRRPIVVMESSDYSRELAYVYQTNLANQGIDVVYTFYYLPWNSDYRGILSEMEHMNYDIVFVSMDGNEATDIIEKARNLGMKAPIMGINLNTRDIRTRLGKASSGIYNLVFFKPGLETPKVTQFVHAFEKRFNESPDNWSAKGYDTLYLLAHMIEKTGNTDPFEIAANMRYLDHWEGITGSYSYSRNGDVVVSPCYLEELDTTDVHYRSEETFPPPTLPQMLHRIFERDIDQGKIEISTVHGVYAVIIEESLFFRTADSNIDYAGRRVLDGIGKIFERTDSTSLHVLSQLDNQTVVMEAGIGDHLDVELADIRAMTVGSYLIGQGVDSKQIFIEGSDQEDLFPDRLVPPSQHITGNRIEILFVPDNLLAVDEN